MSDTSGRPRRHLLLTATLDGVDPAGRVRLSPAALAEFGGLDGFLLAVHHRWYTAFTAHLDAVLEERPADLPAAVTELWRSLTRRHAAVRAVLDAHRHRPALRAAAERERQRLLTAVGIDLAALPEPLPEPLPEQRSLPARACPLTRWRAGAGLHRAA